MILIGKPKIEDVSDIKKILDQWAGEEYTETHSKRVSEEIEGKTEFNLHFWIARENKDLVGIIGLSDPLPKVLTFTRTEKPAEIKILYVDKSQQSKGIGRTLVSFIEDEAERQGYTELLVRSAEKYKDISWGFYQKLGYAKVGSLVDPKIGEAMQVFEKKLL